MKFRLWIVILLAPSLASSATTLLSVVGQCRKEVAPNRIALVMTARAIEERPSDAANKVAALYEHLRAEVIKLDLKDMRLQTSVYSVGPHWEYQNGERVTHGFLGLMGLRVETSDIERGGELLALASKLGLQEISSPVSFLSTALREKEYEKCLEVAIRNARAKADRMAAAAGGSIVDIVSLRELKEMDFPRGPEMAVARMKSEVVTPTLEVRPEIVAVSVSAKYHLRYGPHAPPDSVHSGL